MSDAYGWVVRSEDGDITHCIGNYATRSFAIRRLLSTLKGVPESVVDEKYASKGLITLRSDFGDYVDFILVEIMDASHFVQDQLI